MSSLSHPTQRYGHSDDLTPRKILIATTVFLSGGFAGLFFSTLLFFSQVHKDLAVVHKDLDVANRRINDLTGRAGSASEATNLLKELNEQENAIAQAELAIQSLKSLSSEVRNQTLDIDYARQELEQVAMLIDDVDYIGERLDVAVDSVERIRHLQSDLAAQDGQVMYSLDAVDRVRDLNQRLLALASNEDALHGALTGIDILSQRVHTIGERADDAAYTLDGLDRLVARHEELGAQLPGLEWDVETMNGIIRSVSEQTTRVNRARKTAREMSALCDFVNSHDVSITNAMDTIEDIGHLEHQVANVSREVEEMVDAFQMVQGMNEAINGVLMSSDRLRLGLAELMLLEPAIDRLVKNWNRMQTEIYPVGGVHDKKEVAQTIIEEHAGTVRAEGVRVDADNNEQR